MLYALNEAAQTRPLVLGTLEGKPTVTDLDYCKSHGWQLVTLEEAVARGALTRNKLGKEVWLGVNIKVKIEDRALRAWWLGKWRPMAYWGRTKRPSDKWVQAQLERVLRVNIPLDPVTQIIFNWKEEV